MKSILVVLTLASACTFVAGAPARADSDIPSRVVHYSQTDLSSPVGIDRIYSRLITAAKLVCDRYDSMELARRQVFDRCVAESLARAVGQVHDERLTLYHESQTRPSAAAIVVSSSTPIR
jgi:UrcA family protein